MRKGLILLGLFMMLSACWSFAQNDSHFSLFEYSQNLYNPGAAGANNAICITSMHRQQWVGYEEGRPQTTIFTFDMPIKDFMGLGAVVMQENIGFHNDVSFMINGAYRHEFSFGILGAGVSLGMLNRNIDGNWQTPESLEGDPVYRDQAIPHKDSKTTFDMHIGATLYGKDFWAGISASHLTKPYLKFSGTKSTYLARHYYIAGGYNWTLPNPSSDLLFSAMAVYASTVEFQINVKYLYEKKFWAGLSYRYSDAIVPMLGIHLAMGLSIGYSYDIPLGKNSYKYNTGSHEIMVRYCFNVSRNNNMGRYRSVRRL